MGNLKSLEARLARLEARVAAVPDPEEEKERDKVWLLHGDSWLLGGSLEDIPEKDRDPSTWELLVEYGPVYLELVWEGTLEGRAELLNAGVDFTRVDGVDEDDVAAVRSCGIPGPEVAPKHRGSLSLPLEDGS